MRRYGSSRPRRLNRRRPVRRRKAVHRVRRGAKTTLRNVRPAAIIADRFITKMKYADRLSATVSATGITGAYLFNLNSLFDPDRSGIGHQPWGRDQLALLYHRYRVFAVSWRVTYFATPNLATFTVVPINSEQASSGQSLATTREQPRAISKQSSSDKPTVFSGRVSLNKLTGQTVAEYKGSDRYQSLADGSPTELMTLQVCANTFSGTAAMPFDIQLTYHAEWFDPLPVGPS